MGQAIVVKGANYSAKNLGKVTLPYNTPFSTDSLAYLNAVGENKLSDKGRAINNFIDALIKTGIWSKIDSAYPFYGDTAAKVNVNMKNPTQLASLEQGAIVSGGVSLAYTTSKVLLNNNITRRETGHLLVYNKTLENGSDIRVMLSSKSGATGTNLTLARSTSTQHITAGAAFGLTLVKIPQVNEIGTLIATYDGTKNSIFSRGVKKGELATGQSENAVEELYLGLNVGSTNYNTESVISFVSVGQGLTDAEVVIYNDLVEALVSQIH